MPASDAPIHCTFHNLGRIMSTIAIDLSQISQRLVGRISVSIGSGRQRRSLLILLGLLLVAAESASFSVISDARDSQIVQEPVFEAPVFISVVFPVIELKEDWVEMMPIIPDAYDFRGKTIISISKEKFYYPAPLSYPYRFTDRGLRELQARVRQIAEVEPSSIKGNSFPNVTSEQHYLFEPSELKQIIKREPYISFQLKGHHLAEVMAFPAFVVINLDYTRSKITSRQE